MKLQKGGPKHDGFIRLCRIIIRGTGSTTYYFDMYDENDNKIVDNAVAWPYSSNQTSAPIPLPYGNYFGLTGYKNRKYNLRIGQSKSEVVWLNSLEPVFGCKIDREKAVLGLPTVGNRREILVLDGYIPKGNIAFEFLGNFWHSNPKMYNSKDYCAMLKCTHGQNYAKTVRRFQTLHSLGYKVWYVWEADWKKGSRGKFWKPGGLV